MTKDDYLKLAPVGAAFAAGQVCSPRVMSGLRRIKLDTTVIDLVECFTLGDELQTLSVVKNIIRYLKQVVKIYKRTLYFRRFQYP